jgi:magnesium and cobalt transporter
MSSDPDPATTARRTAAPERRPEEPPREERSPPFYGWLRALLGSGEEPSPRQALLDMITQQPSGPEALAAPERAMLLNLLSFGELRVDDVMVPRADIVAIDHTASLDEVVRLMREAGHSRLPVYRDSLDDVAGMVHVRDLLPFWGGNEAFALERIIRRVLFVPPSMRVIDLLLQMRTARVHMAMVIDEYGGTDGLVTIEDLIEEIVGEIHDEHDVEEGPMLIERPGGVIEASARTPIEVLEERVGYRLREEDEEEDIDTLSGLVSSLAGRLPARGELVVHPSGLEFEVVDADPRRITRLRIHKVPPAPSTSA